MLTPFNHANGSPSSIVAGVLPPQRRKNNPRRDNGCQARRDQRVTGESIDRLSPATRFWGHAVHEKANSHKSEQNDQQQPGLVPAIQPPFPQRWRVRMQQCFRGDRRTEIGELRSANLENVGASADCRNCWSCSSESGNCCGFSKNGSFTASRWTAMSLLFVREAFQRTWRSDSCPGMERYSVGNHRLDATRNRRPLPDCAWLEVPEAGPSQHRGGW